MAQKKGEMTSCYLMGTISVLQKEESSGNWLNNNVNIITPVKLYT